MLTIRGADQVCTSLRAARKSLGEYQAVSETRIAELDQIIGELAVGSKSYVGNPVKSKQEIEALVASLSEPARDLPTGAGHGEGAAGDSNANVLQPGMIGALAHFRRAIATLQRIITAEIPVLQ